MSQSRTTRITQLLRHASVLLWFTQLPVPQAAFPQTAPAGNWVGQAQCQLVVQSQGYVHREVQTWTLTGGPPTQQGAMEIYPAVWSVTSQGSAQRLLQGSQVLAAQWGGSVPGMSAPLVIFVRASDNRLLIGAWHSQLAAPNATVASKQTGGTQASTMAWVYEWKFPQIEDAPTATNVSGTATTTVSGNAIAIPAANASGTATCQWQFTRGGSSITKRAPSAATANIPSAVANNGAPNIPATVVAPAPAPPGDTSSVASQAGSTNSTQVAERAPAATSGVQAANTSNNPIASALKPPPPPTGFTATAWDLGAVHFEWQPVTGAAKYRLEGPGLDASGVYVSAPATNATVSHIPPGANSWKLASVNAIGNWDRNNEATASAIVRYPPPHSPQWLTKSNGAGNPAAALAHYLSLCNQCIPGANFKDIMLNLGLVLDPLATFPDAGPGCGDYPWCGGFGDPWVDDQAARYTNVTEFENSARATNCWNIGRPNGRIVCYTKTMDHGLQVIVKQSDVSWFLSFTSADPNFEVFDWVTYDPDQLYRIPLGQRLTSAYTLTNQVSFDSEGTKYPPHACLACHGGKLTANGVTGATLLPLDPGLLKLPDGYVAEIVRKVNQAVVDAGPSAAVARYLTGLYGVDPHIATKPGDPNYVPQGWQQQANTYNTAIKPYCMMCHLATPSNLDFTIPGTFNQNKDLIYTAICSAHSMPHAEAPYKGFWTKDTGPFFMPGWLVAQLGHQSCP